ncbi:MAG: hypothetical protein U1F65_02815 [Verrucomicrobiota bacterium]
MSILIIAAAFVLTGILVGSLTASSAPIGYEDETGFHFGSEHGAELSSPRQSHIACHPSAVSLTPKPA